MMGVTEGFAVLDSLKKRTCAAVCMLIAFALVLFALSGCAAPKSDEERIEDRVMEFVKDYNNGDFEGVVSCLDTQSRMVVKGMAGLLGYAAGADVEGILDDIFGMTPLISGDGKLLEVGTPTITMTSESSATVILPFSYEDYQQSYQDDLRLHMVKEGDDWFIYML